MAADGVPRMCERAGVYASHHGYLGLWCRLCGPHVRAQRRLHGCLGMHCTALAVRNSTAEGTALQFGDEPSMHLCEQAPSDMLLQLSTSRWLPVLKLLIPGRAAARSRQAHRQLRDTAHLLVVMFMEHLLHLCMGPGLCQGVKVVFLQAAVGAASGPCVCSVLWHRCFTGSRSDAWVDRWLDTAFIKTPCCPTSRHNSRLHVYWSSSPI